MSDRASRTASSNDIARPFREERVRLFAQPLANEIGRIREMEDVQGGVRHAGLEGDGLGGAGESRRILEAPGTECVVAADDEAGELVGDDARCEPERPGQVVACRRRGRR